MLRIWFDGLSNICITEKYVLTGESLRTELLETIDFRIGMHKTSTTRIGYCGEYESVSNFDVKEV